LGCGCAVCGFRRLPPLVGPGTFAPRRSTVFGARPTFTPSHAYIIRGIPLEAGDAEHAGTSGQRSAVSGQRTGCRQRRSDPSGYLRAGCATERRRERRMQKDQG
jgi:hypothetical protein